MKNSKGEIQLSDEVEITKRMSLLISINKLHEANDCVLSLLKPLTIKNNDLMLLKIKRSFEKFILKG